ncbi:hypothetical protein LIER_21621 [Lithospermum erythrorhizon]|uniref:Retrovirus-related Pol polyprotein from transposon TNT 1-94-like beta-barrel domain-containing protein n=1 Tax=Lithospermum erythrorhizon TaxID=34254 RepID=A0AAV3QUC0_LITER
MLDRLYVKQLARPIEEEGIIPPNTDQREWGELDRRCLGFIRYWGYTPCRKFHHCFWMLEETAGLMVSNTIFNEELRRGGSKDNGQSSSGHDTLLYENKRGGGKKKFKSLAGKQKNSKKKIMKNKNNDNKVALVDHDSDLIVVGEDVCYTASEERWVIDSGASFHVTPHKHMFKTYTEGCYGEAMMGNNHVSKIVAMGEICLKSNNGSLIVLKDVRHIPDFRMSLISTGKLDDEGYSNLFEQGRWKLTKNGKIMATGFHTTSTNPDASLEGPISDRPKGTDVPRAEVPLKFCCWCQKINSGGYFQILLLLSKDHSRVEGANGGHIVKKPASLLLMYCRRDAW